MCDMVSKDATYELLEEELSERNEEILQLRHEKVLLEQRVRQLLEEKHEGEVVLA